MLKEVIGSYISHLKVGFSLCRDVDKQKIELAFASTLQIAEKIKEEDVKSVETALLFLDFYPFLSLCGCSSIASANLYPEDIETKTLGHYEVLKQVSLTNHILGGLIQLGRLFDGIIDGSIFKKINEVRIELTAKDYFLLMVSYLYHDVGKSPQILHSVFRSTEDYRKTDHAFASGQLLLYLRHELGRHGTAIPDSLFHSIYLPVIEHHQRPTTLLSMVLKYIDHKTREVELQLGKTRLGKIQEVSPEGEDEDKVVVSPAQVKQELDMLSQIPDSLMRAFVYGSIHKLLPKRRRMQGKVFQTYIHFPPSVYVGSFHVKYLLLYVAKKAGVVLPALEEMDDMSVARLLIRKAREEGYIKENMFQRDLLAGWWYKVKTREGRELFFFGFPLYVGERLVKADTHIVDIRPLSKEEIEQMKKAKAQKS